LAVSLLALLVIGVGPMAWLVVGTLADVGPSQLRVLLRTGRQWHLLGNSLLLGGLVGLGTTLVGTPEAISHRPATAFVQRFIGGTNVLDGMVMADGRMQTAYG